MAVAVAIPPQAVVAVEGKQRTEGPRGPLEEGDNAGLFDFQWLAASGAVRQVPNPSCMSIVKYLIHKLC